MLQKTGAVPFLLAPILGLLIFPFLAVILLLNEVVRLLVAAVLLLVYGNSVELVSDGADAFWGYKREGSSRNVVTYVITPANSLDPDKIINFYRENIQHYRDKDTGHRRYKKFEKVMTTRCGYVCWKNGDYKFNVSDHFRVLNETRIFNASELQQMLTELSQDMDESKPQWEIIMVPKYDDGSGEIKTILLCRFLHAYMDGLSFMMLFKEHITPDMEYTIDPLTFKIPFWKKVLFYINTFIYGPFFCASMTLERFFITPWVLRDPESLKNEVPRKFYTWAKSRPISDDTIRKIRAHSGVKATVTNVLATAFVSAAVKILPPERLVDEILLSELVAYLPYKNPNPTNRFAYFTYPIPAKKVENVWSRLRNCKKESLKSMLGPDILSTFYFIKMAGRFPSFLAPFWLSTSYSSVLLSNAPFSKSKVCFRDGTPILEMAGFTPQPNAMGLSITTTRYGDEVQVFACADSTWLSQDELTRLIDEIPIEIENMSRDIDIANNNVSTLDNKPEEEQKDVKFPTLRNRRNKSLNEEEEEKSQASGWGIEFNDVEMDQELFNNLDAKRISITETDINMHAVVRNR